MSQELPSSMLVEYDDAALWCAERGIKGKIGDPLPANMGSPGAIDYINADPEAFEDRVRQMAYMISMDKVLSRRRAKLIAMKG